MFDDTAPTGPLWQGDVCTSIPVPLLVEESRVVAKGIAGLAAFPGTDPSKVTHFAIAAFARPLMVLSQSCDAEEVESSAQGRILVAPLATEEESALSEKYRAAIVRASEPDLLAKAILAKDGSVPSDVKAVTENAQKRQLEALKGLWLGRVIGAFPVAKLTRESVDILPRSVCHFDHVISLPSAWTPLLKERRVARLTPTWRSILQEALGQWLQRFAFPGTLDERLRVGLSDELGPEGD